jgi:hypothetical protein
MFWRRTPKTKSPAPAAVASVDDVALAMKFVAEAGKQMLESSPSVSGCWTTSASSFPVVGLEGAMIDANLSTLTLSFWGRVWTSQ